MTKKKKRDMSKPANNTGLSWSVPKDQPAIEALKEIAKELGYDIKDTLRWVCVNMKAQAIEKAKEIKKVLNAA
jgi:uracil DNA glycosylase